MPWFKVEQFETHVRKHFVEADNEGQAIVKVLKGHTEGENPSTYDSINLDVGESLEVINEETLNIIKADSLTSNHLSEGYLESIKSVEELEK